MEITLNSKIKDLNLHPIGQHVLQNLLAGAGRGKKWPLSFVNASMPIKYLDRIAGAGFAKALVSAINSANPNMPFSGTEDSPAWWKESIIYQIHLPDFANDNKDTSFALGSVIQRMPYFSRLGVNILWFRSFLEARPSNKPSPENFYCPAPSAGTPENLDTMIDVAHAHGIRVILGVDISSVSSENPWFVSAKNDIASPYRSFFTFASGQKDKPPKNPENWQWLPECSSWAFSPDGTGGFALNFLHTPLRKAMREIMHFWLARGVDGFCLENLNQLYLNFISNTECLALTDELSQPAPANACPQPACKTLQEIFKDIFATDDILLAGELHKAKPETINFFALTNNQGLDLLMDSSYLTSFPTGATRKLERMKTNYLRQLKSLPTAARIPLFLENHCTPRLVSLINANPVYQNVLAKALATALLTARGTPIIYQGEELGASNPALPFSSGAHPSAEPFVHAQSQTNLNKQTTAQANIKTQFHFSAHLHRFAKNTYYTNANAQIQDPASVWQFYQKIIALRKSNPAFAYGDFKPVFLNKQKVFCFFRNLGDEKWYVEINLTEKETVRHGQISPNMSLVLSNYGTPMLTLRPFEATIFRCD